jgi:Na+-driven multidrug efflux pump
MLVLGFWLVRSFGILGAAIGFLAANFVTSAVRAGIFLRLPGPAAEVQQGD